VGILRVVTSFHYLITFFGFPECRSFAVARRSPPPCEKGCPDSLQATATSPMDSPLASGGRLGDYSTVEIGLTTCSFSQLTVLRIVPRGADWAIRSKNIPTRLVWISSCSPPAGGARDHAFHEPLCSIGPPERSMQ